MKKIWGIIGAMEIEVSSLQERLSDAEIYKIASMYFYKGSLEGNDVVVVRSGVGKVNAALCTQILVDRFNVSVIINTGMAGSLTDKLNVGDILISSEAMQHDMDATGFGYKKGEIPSADTSLFPASRELMDLALECAKDAVPHIKVMEGRVLTGDQFISDNVKKKELVEEMGGMCAEMEGAAIAQGAFLNKVPFLIIRCISDNADSDAGISFDKFEKMAAENSVALVTSMICRS